jgi:hypothetical protein
VSLSVASPGSPLAIIEADTIKVNGQGILQTQVMNDMTRIHLADYRSLSVLEKSCRWDSPREFPRLSDHTIFTRRSRRKCLMKVVGSFAR